MSYTPLTESIELYRSDRMTLAQAAAHGGVSTEEFASALRSKGIDVPETDDAIGTTTRS